MTTFKTRACPTKACKRLGEVKAAEAVLAAAEYAAAPSFGNSDWMARRPAVAAAKAALRSLRATQAEVAAAASARQAAAEARKASLKAQYAVCARSCAQMIALGKGVARKAAVKPAIAVAATTVVATVRITGKTARVAARRALHQATKGFKALVAFVVALVA